MRDNTIIRFYCPITLNAEELMEVIAAIETITKQELPYTSAQCRRKLQPVPDRAKWLAEVLGDTDRLFLLMNGYHPPILTLSSQYYPPVLYAQTTIRHLILELPAALRGTADELFSLCQEIGTKSRAYWGAVYPPSISMPVALQSQPTYEPSAPGDLPRLVSPARYGSPYVPANLGWVNYWSSQTVSAMGTAQDLLGELFHRIEPSGGGWTLQVSEGSAEGDRERVLERLRLIYERIPSIGGQDLPQD